MWSVKSDRKLTAIRVTETKDKHGVGPKQVRSAAAVAENATRGRNGPQKRRSAITANAVAKTAIAIIQ